MSPRDANPVPAQPCSRRASSPRPRKAPPSAAARCSRATSRPTMRVDHLPTLPSSDAVVALDRPRRRPPRRLRLRPLRGPADRDPVRRRLRAHAALARALRLCGESDRVRYPIPRGVHIEGGSTPTATATRCWSTATRAGSTSCSTSRAGPGAGARAPAPPGTCARARSAPPAGRAPTPPACRSCRCSRATRRSPRGRIDHALRVTVSRSRRAYVYPARHFASSDPDPSLPRMGERLRLKRGVDVSRLPRQARVIATALKRYGLIVADNGSDWFVSGAPNARWDNDQLRALAGSPGATSRSSTPGRCGAEAQVSVTCTRPPATASERWPPSSASSSAPTSSRRQPRSVRTSGSGAPRRAATTIGARSARAAISS